MKTLVIRKGRTLTIRAIATETDGNQRDKCPTLAFFEEQMGARQAEMLKLGALLTQTADTGPPQNECKFKNLPGSDGIYEFKTPGGLRLFAFWDEGSWIVCTHGFLKGSQKTRKSEIQRAERLKREYFESKRKGDLRHDRP